MCVCVRSGRSGKRKRAKQRKPTSRRAIWHTSIEVTERDLELNYELLRHYIPMILCPEFDVPNLEDHSLHTIRFPRRLGALLRQTFSPSAAKHWWSTLRGGFQSVGPRFDGRLWRPPCPRPSSWTRKGCVLPQLWRQHCSSWLVQQNGAPNNNPSCATMEGSCRPGNFGPTPWRPPTTPLSRMSATQQLTTCGTRWFWIWEPRASCRTIHFSLLCVW